MLIKMRAMGGSRCKTGMAVVCGWVATASSLKLFLDSVTISCEFLRFENLKLKIEA